MIGIGYYTRCVSVRPSERGKPSILLQLYLQTFLVERESQECVSTPYKMETMET